MTPDFDIKETLPDAIVRSGFWNHFFVLWTPTTILFSAVFVAASFSAEVRAQLDPRDAILAGGVLSLSISALAALGIAALGVIEQSRVKANIPTVALRNRELFVQYGETNLHARLDDCRIRRRGPIWRMMLTWREFNPWIAKRRRGIRIWGWKQVILIELPPFGRTLTGTIASMNTVAVGFTSDALRRWDRALGIETMVDRIGWQTKIGDVMMFASWAAPGDGRSRFDGIQDSDESGKGGHR